MQVLTLHKPGKDTVRFYLENETAVLYRDDGKQVVVNRGIARKQWADLRKRGYKEREFFQEQIRRLEKRLDSLEVNAMGKPVDDKLADLLNERIRSLRDLIR